MLPADQLKLREKAENKLSHASVTALEIRTAEQLLHELQVHQIELEMQNDELRLTQATLEASRDLYADLFNNAPVGYLTLTESGLITDINVTAAELLGLERNDLLSKNFSTLLMPRECDRWYLFCKNIKYHQSLNIDLALKDRNGVEVFVEVNCRNINSLLRIALTNLTTIKQMESAATATAAAATAAAAAAAAAGAAELHHRHVLDERTQIATIQKVALARLEKIASQLPGMVYQFQLNVDGSYSFPYLSQGVANIFCLSTQKAIDDPSKLFALVHHEDYDDLWTSIFQSAQDLSHWDHELRIKFEDGTIRWLSGNAIPERKTDGSTLWHGFLADITKRKQIELELQESRFLFDFAIESSEDGFWDWNIQTNEVVFTSSWRKMLGYNEGDISPAYIDWLTLVHPDDQAYMAEKLQEYLHGSSAKYRVECRLRCKDGSYKWILGRGRVVSYGEDGKPLRMIGINTDISKIKRQEQKSKEHLEQLAHVTRIGLMGEMASGIAHEVNQPLCAIATYAQVSVNLIKKENPDLLKLAEIMAKTQQQALRAGQIIHRMKDFCRSKSGVKSPVDINTLIANCVELCKAELIHNTIKLTIDLEENLPTTDIDQIQIEQVLINLVRNSIDSFQDVDKEHQREITIHSYRSMNNTLSVSVKDNGCGLDEALQEKMMTPFYTTKTNGMGMGLAISRSLIEAHEGTLFFNSIPGKGSTFYFTLPVSA